MSSITTAIPFELTKAIVLQIHKESLDAAQALEDAKVPLVSRDDLILRQNLELRMRIALVVKEQLGTEEADLNAKTAIDLFAKSNLSREWENLTSNKQILSGDPQFINAFRVHTEESRLSKSLLLAQGDPLAYDVKHTEINTATDAKAMELFNCALSFRKRPGA